MNCWKQVRNIRRAFVAKVWRWCWTNTAASRYEVNTVFSSVDLFPNYLKSRVQNHTKYTVSKKTHLMLLAGSSTTHTTHQPASVRATHIWLRKTIVTSVSWTLQTRHTADIGEWILISWCTGEVRHLFVILVIVTVIHCKQSYFCILQGSAATLFRQVGEFTIFWCEIFSGFCTPKHY